MQNLVKTLLSFYKMICKSKIFFPCRSFLLICSEIFANWFLIYLQRGSKNSFLKLNFLIDIFQGFWILFSITPVLVSTKSEVLIRDFFNKFEDISKKQLLMYSHFLKKFLKETLYFSGCWLFLNKWIKESVVTNITPP